jgi:type II secretory pathway pseudopilin PulG
MNQRIRNITQSGQTIVEVLVAVAVMGLVLTAVAAMLSLSVKNSAETRSKALATQRAQEAVEVFRRERKVQGWTAFVANVPDGVVCLNGLPSNSDEFNGLNTGACGEGVAEAGTEFTRQALISFPASGIVTIEATVSWMDGNKPRSVVVTQQLQDSL